MLAGRLPDIARQLLPLSPIACLTNLTLSPTVLLS
jgi:hypothetical protein